MYRPDNPVAETSSDDIDRAAFRGRGVCQTSNDCITGVVTHWAAVDGVHPQLTTFT